MSLILNSKRLLILFMGILSFSITSCEDEEEVPKIQLPSNLSITVELDTNVAGLVKVQATASNANYYSITFFEGSSSSSQESTNGQVNHRFLTEGTHTVRVRAHATAAEFVEGAQVIVIAFDTSGSGGGGGGGGGGSTGPYPTSGYTTPLSYANYTLMWNDEFDGNSLNLNNWNYEIGTGSGGWGNNELQYYLQANTSVADGYLTITAKNELSNGSSYTSSRLTTKNKRSFQYGRIDIRAAMPFGKGLWPALWMLGENFPATNWPACGEIDIMEMVGGTTTDPKRGDKVTHGTVHWDNAGTYASYGNSKKISTGTLADEFHVYSIVWDSQKIEWYLDDVKYHVIDISPADLSEFHQKYFFIFNIAVGGNWPGSPNTTTVFPQYMYVDYVRVFQ